jgi:EF-hand domain pair
MKKNVMPLIAAAMTLTFTACQPADNVEPVAADTATNTSSDQLLSSVIAFVGTPANTGSYLNVAKARGGGYKLTPAQIKAAFDALDEDKSGQISGTELTDTLTKLGVNVSASQVAQLIKMFDANNSGMMEFNEFERLIDEALKHAK